MGYRSDSIAVSRDIGPLRISRVLGGQMKLEKFGATLEDSKLSNRAFAKPGNHRNDGNDESHGSPGCKPRLPQTTGLEIPDLNP